MTKFKSLTIVNLVTLKVGAKQGLLFNKPDSEVGLLNVQVRLKQDSKVWPKSYHTWSHLKLQLSKASLLKKGSCLARALGVTKFLRVIVMNSVSLCCAA